MATNVELELSRAIGELIRSLTPGAGEQLGEFEFLLFRLRLFEDLLSKGLPNAAEYESDIRRLATRTRSLLTRAASAQVFGRLAEIADAIGALIERLELSARNESQKSGQPRSAETTEQAAKQSEVRGQQSGLAPAHGVASDQPSWDGHSESRPAGLEPEESRHPSFAPRGSEGELEAAPSEQGELRAEELRTDAPERDQEPEPLGSPRRRRYANAALLAVGSNDTLDSSVPLVPGATIRLRLDIGALSDSSQVASPVAFPDRHLPPDVELDVMVSSSDFAVGYDGLRWNNEGVAENRFLLPGDGGSAIAPGGGHYVEFMLRVPDAAEIARCRIGYYFRNILVQSMRLVAEVGRGRGFRIDTDYTLSEDLTSLADIPARPRVSVLLNANGFGDHQIVLRSVGPSLVEARGSTFRVNEVTLGKPLARMRGILEERAPTKKERTKSELIADLRLLATTGWKLYALLAAQHSRMFQPVYEKPEEYVIQVVRPDTSGFVVPWALIYEIPLDSDARRHEVCRSVEEWVPDRLLFEGEPRQCPEGPHGANVLCPFGFWGMRYTIEQLSRTDRADLEIPFRGNPVVAQTRVDVNEASLKAHVQRLRETVTQAFPQTEVREAVDRDAVKNALGCDVPLVYFFCHGERSNVEDPDTWLSVGRNEMITASDIIGWFVSWQHENKVLWDQVRPLVFINACHSLAVMPTTLVSYLDAFVTNAHAAGVIGTEARINQAIAMDVAERFLKLFVEGRTVDSALRTIRMEYLRSGNLVGLVYTPYCWSDLQIAKASLRQ